MQNKKRETSSGTIPGGTSFGVEFPQTVERRIGLRKQFIADAQITELDNGVQVSARNSDLVVQGCYVDTLNPLPVDTLVHVRLSHGSSVAETDGRVVYQIPGFGMGIAFHEISDEARATLEEWLGEVSRGSGSFELTLPAVSSAEALPESPAMDRFGKLVSLLLKKGILSQGEAVALLGDCKP